MSWVAVAVAGGAVVGGYMASQGAQNAANTQAGAARDASASQERIYQMQREDFRPWREAGANALNQMGDSDFKRDFTMADFTADPGYAFRLSEGQKAIERSAAARGGLNSGGTMKALTRFGQDYGSQEYGNAYNRFNSDRDRRFNRLASIAGVGQTATQATSNAAQNFGNNVSSNIMAAGNAQAAGQIGSANAINNAMGQGMNTWMSYQLMNRAFPKTGTT